MSGLRASTGAAALVDAIALAAVWIAALSLIVMTAVQFWQVFARYVLNDSPSWTEPVALLAMKSAMMFGAAAGVRSGSHFGFFIAVQSASPALQRWLRAFAQLVMLAIGGVLAFWGFVLALDGWGVPMAGVALPEGAAYLPIAFGGALIALFAAAAER